MQIVKIASVAIFSVVLTGCATKSLSMSDSDKASFYSPPLNSMASVYLTCGRSAKNGDYDAILFPSENGA